MVQDFLDAFAAVQRWCRFSITLLRVTVDLCTELAFKARLTGTSWYGTTKPSTASELAQRALYESFCALLLFTKPFSTCDVLLKVSS